MHDLRGDRLLATVARGRSTCPEWFELAEDVAARCHAVVASMRQAQGVRDELALEMFSRTVSSLQVGTLLVSIERLLEANVITRSGVEALFLLSAFAYDTPSVDRYLRSHDARRMQLLNKLEKLPGRADFADDAWFSRMRPWAEDMASGAADLKLKEFARAGGLESVYDTVYAVLSGPAHHLPVSAVRNMGRKTEGGPAAVLDRLTMAPMLGLTALGEVFGFDAEAQTSDLVGRFRAIRPVD